LEIGMAIQHVSPSAAPSGRAPSIFLQVLSWVVWPLSIALFITAVVWFSDLGDQQSIFTVASRALFVALIAQIGLEMLMPHRADWRIRGDKDIWRDIAHLVLYGIVGDIVAQILFIATLGAVLAPVALQGLWPAHLPLLVQVIIVMVAGEFLEYWLHRLSHRIPALWRVHAIHHMPVRLNLIKAGRHHILYFLLRGLMVWTPLMLLGVPPQLIVWQFVALGIAGNISHANIDLRIPAFMHRILVTPQFHRLHHSADARQGNSNFGVTLPVWDMIFGTHVDPVRNQVAATGIEGDPIPHRFFTELLLPFSRKTRV
jgi:ornithine lipid hydroxylase